MKTCPRHVLLCTYINKFPVLVPLLVNNLSEDLPLFHSLINGNKVKRFRSGCAWPFLKININAWVAFSFLYATDPRKL